MPAIFDAYLIVDWSAAGRPGTGADSVWLHCLDRAAADQVSERQHNPATRHEAMALIADWLSDQVARDRTALLGVDFALGYPAGTAAGLGRGGDDWRAVWRSLAQMVADGDDNANNRFEVAAALNRQLSGSAFPFWSCPKDGERPDLAAKKPKGYGGDRLAEYRLTDRWPPRPAPSTGPRPKSVWQLFGTGSVGGQTLLGIAHLERLRQHPWLDGRARVWPFETGLRPLARPSADGWRVLFAEVYPSLLADDDGGGDVPDARQVRRLARHFARLDDDGRLAALFAGPEGIDAGERQAIEREEGWILGVQGPRLRPIGAGADGAANAGADTGTAAGAAAAGGYAYVRDPAEIYRRSFATIRAEADLTALPEELEPLAVRLIHAAGDPAIAARLHASAGAVAAGRAALALGRPILVDTEMVAAGIIRRLLPAGNRVCCTLADADVPARAKALATTRSAAAVDAWVPLLDGAVVAIGNAPTALFRLLELIDGGAPRPALILGFPVGFVGAAESKEALIAHKAGVAYVTLSGRRGGSAFAAAALNALAGREP